MSEAAFYNPKLEKVACIQYFDIANFEVEKGLSARLGYRNVFCAGRDVQLSENQPSPRMPSIIVSGDHGTLIQSLRNPDVVGIIIKGNFLDKKVVEKVAEIRKAIFIPVAQLTTSAIADRRSMSRDIRKLVYYAHRARAKVRLVTLAASKEQLLSSGQMKQVAALLMKDGSEGIFGGTIL